jgi:hypothetical protein
MKSEDVALLAFAAGAVVTMGVTALAAEIFRHYHDLSKADIAIMTTASSLSR